MMLNPGVQRRAQAELDTVVGTSRLPTIEDRPKLPYIDAVVKEALRWNPVVPLGMNSCIRSCILCKCPYRFVGFPHVPAQDDVYRNYLFPKGAVVMPNIW